MAGLLTPRRLKIAAAVLAFVLVALLVERLHVTDADRIEGIVDRMANAVSEGDADALMAELAADFQDEGLDREGVREIAANFFSGFGPTRVRIASSDIIVSGETASADLQTVASLAPHPTAQVQSEWRLGFVKLHGNWHVDSIRPLTLQGQEVPELKALASRYGLAEDQSPAGRMRRRPPDSASMP